MAEHKMEVVDGVRYRPEDAPQRSSSTSSSAESSSRQDASSKTRRTSRSTRRGEHTDDE